MHFFNATSRSSSTSKKQQENKNHRRNFKRMKEKERNICIQTEMWNEVKHIFFLKENKIIRCVRSLTHSLTYRKNKKRFFSSLIFSLDVDGGGEKLVFDFMFTFIYIYSYKCYIGRKELQKMVRLWIVCGCCKNPLAIMITTKINWQKSSVVGSFNGTVIRI